MNGGAGASGGAVAAEGAAAPVAAADLERADEAELRARFAAAPNERTTALDLAAWLQAAERPAAAEPVLATARRHADHVELATAHAAVLRDLGQRHLAVAALQQWVAAHGADSLPAATWFELAELQWLEGDREGARASLTTLAQADFAAAFRRSHAVELAGLGDEVDHAERPRRVKVRDLLGNLRGSPAELVRLRTLERLAQLGTEPGARPIRRRALAIAAGDAAARVRARAVQLTTADDAELVDFLPAALGDEAALVRAVAAERAAALAGELAVPWLLAALERGESDPAVVAALDAALAEVTGQLPLATAAEGSAERLAKAWRTRCTR